VFKKCGKYQKAVTPAKNPIFRDLFSMRVPGYKGVVPEIKIEKCPYICNKVLFIGQLVADKNLGFTQK